MTLSARIDVTTLRKATTLARKVATRRKVTLPALASIRLTVVDGRLELYACDLEQAITIKAPAWDASGGPVAVMAHDLTRLLRGMPRGAATLTVTDSAVTLDADTVRGAVRPVPVEDMPSFEPLTSDSVVLNPDQVEMLAHVAQAASTDEARPVLTAVYIDGTRAAGCDSYRLYRATIHHRRLADGALVPGHVIRTVAQAARGRDVEFAADQWGVAGRTSFAWSRDDLDVELAALNIEGSYPTVGNLLNPAREAEADLIEVDRVQLLDAARRHAAYIGKVYAHTPVYLLPGDGGLQVQTVVDGVALVETLPGIDWPCITSYNPDFLVDVLEAAVGPTITVRVRDGLKPLLIDADGIELLLMPMRTDMNADSLREAAAA